MRFLSTRAEAREGSEYQHRAQRIYRDVSV